MTLAIASMTVQAIMIIKVIMIRMLVSGGPGLFGLSRFRTGLIYDRPEITQAVFGPVPE